MTAVLLNPQKQEVETTIETSVSVLSPVIGTSGLGCSFLHEGTNTVMSVCPRSRKKFTVSWIPRQENTSLFPWLHEWETKEDEWETRKLSHFIDDDILVGRI